MKILYIYEGIDIYYNNGETTKEMIFGLDENGNIIQNITFQTNVSVNDFEFNKIVNNCKKSKIEKGYLFYSFAYEKSFAHYMFQTVPKLYDYINCYSNYTLLIPKHRYNIFSKNILRLLNITNIFILEDNYIYDIDDFIITPLYNCIPDNFSENHIKIYQKIRAPLYITNNSSQNRLVYLKRDGKPNIEYGNSETGILRQLLNEEELIISLQNIGFEIICLGDKTIEKKKELLNDIKICITPLGANCVNFVFCNAPKNIVYLSNTENFGENYYTQLCQNLNNTHINSRIFRYNGISSDPLNCWNNSFSVNIDEIVEYINQLL